MVNLNNKINKLCKGYEELALKAEYFSQALIKRFLKADYTLGQALVNFSKRPNKI